MHHCSRRELRAYLKNKRKYLASGRHLQIKNHLDSCRDCWKRWNRFRWDLAKSSGGFKELQEYLGGSFMWYFDASWALVEEWRKAKPKTFKGVEDFYKRSKNYLYSLTLWHESGDREDYLKEFAKLNRKITINSFLDYGCGIGTDGLKMLNHKKKVYFYDFDNPSLEFLKWRLKKRNKEADILLVEKIKKFPKVDVVWAIDVLEHMIDPTVALKSISNETKAFIHVSQFGEKREGRHPFHFEFNAQILNKELLKMKFILDESSTILNVWVRK